MFKVPHFLQKFLDSEKAKNHTKNSSVKKAKTFTCWSF